MRKQISLFDRTLSELSTAELFDDVSIDDFLATKDVWRPVLKIASALFSIKGLPQPAYSHWDWTSKVDALDRLDVTFFGIEHNSRLQGLMKADTGTLYRCRLPSQVGKELVYVDYLESAPWNSPDYMAALNRKGLFALVGTRLMQAAVELSIENELKGCVGLHSLPDSEGFYQAIGMEPHQRDPDKQNLLWFEFTPVAAQEFLEKNK